MCALQTGAAVYQVLPHEEEGMLTRAPADAADSTTRLVIPDDVITSSMMRCAKHAGYTPQAVQLLSRRLQYVLLSWHLCLGHSMPYTLAMRCHANLAD